MKQSGYLGRLLSIGLPVFQRLDKSFIVLMVFLLLTTSNLLRSAPTKDPIETQMYNDMMFGADDYFGSNSDLSTVDNVMPSGNQSATQTSPQLSSTASTPSVNVSTKDSSSQPTTAEPTVTPPEEPQEEQTDGTV